MKNNLINVLLIFIESILLIILIFYHNMFDCDSFVLNLILVFYILFLIILNFLLKRNEVVNRPMWLFIAVIGFFAINTIYGSKVRFDHIYQNGGRIVDARIYHKYASVKQAPYIDVEFVYNDDYYHSSFNPKKWMYNSLKINDTILIIHSLTCPGWTLLVDYFPDSVQKAKYQNGIIVSPEELKK